MEAIQKARFDPSLYSYYRRPRLNQLFMEAVKYPLVIVCAGAGYGKTSAIQDFLQEYQVSTVWIQLSQLDNVSSRFWENCSHAIAHVSSPFVKAINKLGFPDTADKLTQYFSFVRSLVKKERRIYVMDDFHFIENLPVIRFMERVIVNLSPGTSLFLVSRSIPRINTAGLASKGLIFNINESDLRFTENELSQYFRRQDIFLPSDNLREIMEDTKGWAFSINLIAHSYQKAPGYGGYIRNAVKINIFELMETEIWDGISEQLQNFLIRLSLIDHLSVDLISILANGDEDLLAELERQSAYVRRDHYIDAYLIHHLFLEFLRLKQFLLSGEQKRETYKIAGDWCNKNGFKIDALTYFDKIEDYKSIVSIFFELPTQVPLDIAQYAEKIFNRFPANVFDTVDLLAVMHVRIKICLGLWQQAFELMKYYEEKYSKLPEDTLFKNHTLGGLYYCWGIMRTLMCTTEDIYDFDKYYAKQSECLTKFPIDTGPLSNHPVGPWISLAGSARKGAPEDFINAMKRSVKYISNCMNGAMTGLDILAEGELKFYQSDIRGAEPFVIRAFENAKKHRQFEVEHRALFYAIRIAVSQGDFAKAERALKDMEAQLNENEYRNRYINFDIARSWYCIILNLPENVSDWLKDKFSSYGHAYFIENFGNQVKACYHYAVNNYPPLLTYMQEQRQRESILYGRIEMFAMEACVQYKLKNKKMAFGILEEAYETALPNNIVMPFIELGKDMRTLSASALKEQNINIPKPWLEAINRKAASYAKRQAHIITLYKQAYRIENNISLSTREREVLSDLSHGLSRTEIAVNRSLSVNTIKMIINFLYTKFGAENLVDLIRITTERKLI